MINLRQLRYFAKVVELGSITRAAEKLHISQPSLGVQIKLLEAEMRVALIERHSRGVAVTAAGRRLYDRACEILKQMEALPQQVRTGGAARTRVLTLGLAGSAMRLLGDDILSDAELNSGGFSIQLVEERSPILQEALERGELDLVLGYDLAAEARFVLTPILEEELLLVGAPEFFASEGPVSAAFVLTTPLVLSGARGTIPSVVQAQASRLNTTVEPAFSIHSVPTLKKIVSQGRAAAILPIGQVTEELVGGTLCSRRVEGAPFHRTVYFARMRDNTNATGPDVDLLLSKLTERLRAILGDLGHPVGSLSARPCRSDPGL